MGIESRTNAVRLHEDVVLHPFAKMAEWLRFTPDGNLLVVTGFTGIKLLETSQWQEVAHLEGHTQAVSGGALRADGRLLATGSVDATVRLWSLPDGALLETLAPHKKTVATVAFSPDGTLLASGGYDARVAIHDLAAGIQRALLKGHAGNVVSLAFAPDGKRLASGGLGSEVLVWATESGDPGTPLLKLGGHVTVCAPLAWRNGRLLTTDYAATLRTWDIESGALLDSAKLEIPTVGSAAFSPDGALLAVCAPHMVSFFQADSWELLETHSLPIKGVYCAAWSPDGEQLAVSGADGRIRIFSVER